MEANSQILNLLHDTCLEKVEVKNQTLRLFFSFYLEDDTPYSVELVSENISNVSCLAYFRDESQQTLELSELIELDCIQAKKDGNQLQFAFENTENEVIIELAYQGTKNTFQGNLVALKQFWNLVSVT